MFFFIFIRLIDFLFYILLTKFFFSHFLELQEKELIELDLTLALNQIRDRTI
jgi:hypothetical protein